MDIHLHKEAHLKSSDFITDVVIGMSDGLTVPFALAAGLSSAVSDNHLVTTAGIAEIIAGSIAMGLGGYLAGKTEQDHYSSELRKEYDEVARIPEKEKAEVREIFAGYGLSEYAQNVIADELAKDKDKWVEFMMKYELGLDEPDARRAGKSAATIGISYIVGGTIPLLPYFFTSTPLEGLKISALITLVCLFIFGYFKSKVTGQPVWSGAFKVMIIGAIAAGAAFTVAKLFGA
ncbi:Predicted Fe2+/Mn2+ transporter, VIT1/CCC1 family [Hydrobacter penzbergensis]|jgi:VIT1/CCC1 family predicted Fe2+/Mn2+ transporter|uniref:Predicted Fe2+/Mn2+ transporter, VIT1/CCC1 family n=1 Tax=Hydrobacter penzbergensis TaxID=1235997 RepID=A0A8X8LCC9_9BACT|nr:VIT1/CCC1 transporter family protein [Hydrobacter penzbergensis]MBN8718009.1 VIT1/CCC1 transporter family protein [Sediminibacterium magnilacihabitans]PQV61603.1 VIT1/CCC1 family predicted Fe2+/Mn2+ transporter [Sediminibacterium magnilacihabitans]SDW16313.1 Predicted Fe2+/Mn2+ transporter, VIT1/CCC1 family [Hydrobacter penzbergensis]